MIKVLLLDDDKNLVNTLSRILTLNNCEVDQTVSVSEALSKIENRNYNLLITDYLLGEGTAINILDEVKEKGLDIKTIIISGLSDETVKKKCCDAGADLFIEKPFKLKYFVECINNLFEGKVE